jgi:hypothetical protein
VTIVRDLVRPTVVSAVAMPNLTNVIVRYSKLNLKT